MAKQAPEAMNDTDRSRGTRPRHGTVLVLIVVAAVVGVAATFALWASRQALDTDVWTAMSAKLLDDEDIQVALSAYLVDALFASVDVQSELGATLPPESRGLAVPATAGLRVLGERIALAALQRPVVQRLWEEANRAAHETLMAAVRGGSEVLATTGGVVTLNLVPLVEQVGARLGLDVGGRIPADAGTIEIMRSDPLARVQVGARAIRFWGIALPIVTLGLLLLAVYLAGGWRREALEDVGVALAATGVVVLIVRGVVGAYVVDSLAATPSVEPAARSVWEVGTSLLASSAVGLVAYGIVILLGTWLAGPGRSATRTRRSIAPVLRQRRFAYGVLAVILVLVFWWNPTPATEWIVPSLILVALAIAGLEALRSVSLREAGREGAESRAEAAPLPPRRRAG